jgi:hypothetical protein
MSEVPLYLALRQHRAATTDEPRPATLAVTQGQIASPSPTDAIRFWWHLYRS